MFYSLELTRELEIPPRFLGQKLLAEIHRRLRQDVEGSCTGQHGFIIAVLGILDTYGGLVREGVGSAVFTVRYACLAFMPHKGEALDAVVKSVNKVRTPSAPFRRRLISRPLFILYAHINFASFMLLQMGFFAEAGPLQLFVSNHLIPEEFEFDTSSEPCYATGDGEQKITPGCEVRLRIVGTRVDANEIFAVATMKDDYLGVLAMVSG